MYGDSIEKTLRGDTRTSAFFAGVFAADTLPRAFQRPALFIINTDESRKPGAHWVACYIGEDGRGEFFDSYGMPPLVSYHKEFLKLNCLVWTYNTTTLQALFSKVCGEYCILYAIHRSYGISMDTFIDMYFTSDTQKNDIIVRDEIKKYVSIVEENQCNPSSQCCCERKM